MSAPDTNLLRSHEQCMLQVHGVRCDVSRPDDMAELGRFAKQQLGMLHLWLNNAGSVTRKRMLADVDPADISAAVGELQRPYYITVWRNNMKMTFEWASHARAHAKIHHDRLQ